MKSFSSILIFLSWDLASRINSCCNQSKIQLTHPKQNNCHGVRGFINVFGRRAAGFHRKEKLFAGWSNQAGKINLTASQFAKCPALNETPVVYPTINVCNHLSNFWEMATSFCTKIWVKKIMQTSLQYYISHTSLIHEVFWIQHSN